MRRMAKLAPILILSSAVVAPAIAGAPRAEEAARKPAPAGLGVPLEQMGVWLDGFHKRDGRPDEQLEVTHYCAQLNPDLIQCALFDGTKKDARLIGVEYVITESALQKLPPKERALWHSHAYEVTSGLLHAPGMSPADEHALMEKLAHTYGKTWHTWQAGEALPVGRPSLMMAFTRDGQARPRLTNARDRQIGVSTRELRARRADIASPPLLAGVDRGENGRSCLATPTVKHAAR